MGKTSAKVGRKQVVFTLIFLNHVLWKMLFFCLSCKIYIAQFFSALLSPRLFRFKSRVNNIIFHHICWQNEASRQFLPVSKEPRDLSHVLRLFRLRSTFCLKCHSSRFRAWPVAFKHPWSSFVSGFVIFLHSPTNWSPVFQSRRFNRGFIDSWGKQAFRKYYKRIYNE